MRSYGRAATFLAMTGYERVGLTLPDTGVGGGSGEFDTDGSSAGGCTPAIPELLPFSRAGQS